jgi:hypothetical protein
LRSLDRKVLVDRRTGDGSNGDLPGRAHPGLRVEAVANGEELLAATDRHRIARAATRD